MAIVFIHGGYSPTSSSLSARPATRRPMTTSFFSVTPRTTASRFVASGHAQRLPPWSRSCIRVLVKQSCGIRARVLPEVGLAGRLSPRREARGCNSAGLGRDAVRIPRLNCARLDFKTRISGFASRMTNTLTAGQPRLMCRIGRPRAWPDFMSSSATRLPILICVGGTARSGITISPTTRVERNCDMIALFFYVKEFAHERVAFLTEIAEAPDGLTACEDNVNLSENAEPDESAWASGRAAFVDGQRPVEAANLCPQARSLPPSTSGRCPHTPLRGSRLPQEGDLRLLTLHS